MTFFSRLNTGLQAFKNAFSNTAFARLDDGSFSYNYETERYGLFSFAGGGTPYFSPKQNLKLYYKNIFFLQCCVNFYTDFASQVRINEVDEHGDIVENSDFVSFLKNPNPWQNQTDFIKEMVVNLLTTGASIQSGNFFETGDLRPNSTIYNLDFHNLKFQMVKDPYILSREDIKNLSVIETLNNGQTKKRKLSELAFFFDNVSDKSAESNIVENNLYFNPTSRLFNLLKSLHIIENSEDTMCFLTSNPVNSIISKEDKAGTLPPLDQHQKNDIEKKLNGKGKYGAGTHKAGDIIATNENLKRLDLSRDNKKAMIIEMQQNAKQNVREAFLIPKDFFEGSTYENQQFAEARFILGNVKTITDNWLNELQNKTPIYFQKRKTKLVGSYDHLPSVIAIKSELKNKGFKLKSEGLNTLLDNFQKAKDLDIETDFVKFANDYGFGDFINADR